MRRLVVAIVLAMLLTGCARPDSLRSYPRSGAETRAAIKAGLEAGDDAAVTRHTLALARMGGSVSDESWALIAPHLDLVLMQRASQEIGRVPTVPTGEPQTDKDALYGWLEANRGPPMGGAGPEMYAQVPVEYRLVEGIAWDAETRRLFVATVVDGRLAYHDADENWHEIAVGSPRAGLFGMAVDHNRRLLWIATGSVDQTAVAGERMTGIIAVDLDRLEVVRRVAVAGPKAGAVGDVAVAADGTVYASNAASGAIHRCRPGCTRLEDFQPAGTYRNPQGMAITDNGCTLMVADYVSGLWQVDIRTRKRRPLPIAAPAMLDGIDGLMQLRDGVLVGIQNGTNPVRLVKIMRDRGSKRWRTETNVTFPVEPTLGAVLDDRHVAYIADGQWGRYGAGGVLTDRKPPYPTYIQIWTDPMDWRHRHGGAESEPRQPR